jgi:hypothetical protein
MMSDNLAMDETGHSLPKGENAHCTSDTPKASTAHARVRLVPIRRLPEQKCSCPFKMYTLEKNRHKKFSYTFTQKPKSARLLQKVLSAYEQRRRRVGRKRVSKQIKCRLNREKK